MAIAAMMAFTFTACPTGSGDMGPSHTHTWNWNVTPGGGVALDFGIEECASCGETRNESYFVANKADLLLFSVLANNGNNFSGKTILQTADITLSGNWTPINSFYGVYNGNGKIISDLHINFTLDNGWGLFRLNGGTVKNLTLSGVDIMGKGDIGGVTAENRGTVQDCHVSGYVYNLNAGWTGGVVGNNSGGKVIDCSVSGYISGADYTGGVAGFNHGTITGCSVSGVNVTGANRVGGVAGHNISTVTGCSVYGDISGAEDTGGVAGHNIGTITGCSFTGNSVMGVKKTGGVAGINNGGKVIDCHASGAISSSVDEAGGVVGYLNLGEVSNCYATGTVSTPNLAGGVVGLNQNSKVTYCVALNTSISGANNMGRVIGFNYGINVISTNNYASSAMTVGGSTVAASSTGATTIHGESVNAADYNTQSWWTTAAVWNFGASGAWKWDNTLKLPVFK